MKTIHACCYMWHRPCGTKINSARKFQNAKEQNFYVYENFCDYSAYAHARTHTSLSAPCWLSVQHCPSCHIKRSSSSMQMGFTRMSPETVQICLPITSYIMPFPHNTLLVFLLPHDLTDCRFRSICTVFMSFLRPRRRSRWSRNRLANRTQTHPWMKEYPNAFLRSVSRLSHQAWNSAHIQRCLHALCHAIQNSMEAILDCHPALSTEWVGCGWLAISCELWRLRTSLIETTG